MNRPLQPCGTVAAYVRHLRHREPPCAACCDAKASAQRAWFARGQRGEGPSTPITNHGTDAGYRRHQVRGEKPCQACRDAHNTYSRDYYHANKPRPVRAVAA